MFYFSVPPSIPLQSTQALGAPPLTTPALWHQNSRLLARSAHPEESPPSPAPTPSAQHDNLFTLAQDVWLPGSPAQPPLPLLQVTLIWGRVFLLTTSPGCPFVPREVMKHMLSTGSNARPEVPLGSFLHLQAHGHSRKEEHV